MLATVLWKLRTGTGWAAAGEAAGTGHGTTAFKHWKRVVAAGVWETIWREVVANPDGAGFTPAELHVATEWLLEHEAIGGSVADWVGEAPTEAKEEATPATKAKPAPCLPLGGRQRTERIRETPDGLWDRFHAAIQKATPTAATGRKRTGERDVMDAFWFQTRTGCAWADTQSERGSYATVHHWMSRWTEAGVFRRVFEGLVREADSLGLVDWEHQCVDGTMLRARFCRGGEENGVGPNPTDRARNGSKRSVMVDGNGLPISIVVASARLQDRTLLQETLDRRVRPIAEGIQQTLIVDRGYSGRPPKRQIEAAGYVYRAPQRNKNDRYKALDRPLTQEEKNIRGGVERCHAWMTGSRAVLTRHARKLKNYEAQCYLTAIFLWWRRIERELDRRAEITAAA